MCRASMGTATLRAMTSRRPRSWRASTGLFVEAGTERGAEVLRELPAAAATESCCSRGSGVEGAAQRMGRKMEAADLSDLLAENLDHPRWDDVAELHPQAG